MKKYIISSCAAFILSTTSFAGTNYDDYVSQTKDILTSAMSANQFSAFEKIKKLFDANEMLLKNVVYRKDTNVIRITFANKDNTYCIKTAYKTNVDGVLENSLFADKNNIVDIKVMYLLPGEKTYHYLRIQHNRVIQDVLNDHLAKQIPNMPPLNEYVAQGNLSNEQCLFCHEVARHDGSPSGLFFTRYQGGDAPLHVERIFSASKFEMKKKEEANTLHLPLMSENFMFERVEQTVPDYTKRPIEKQANSAVSTYARIMFETPELLEVLAQDNQKSYCFSVLFAHGPFDGDNYVCADYAAKKLYVKFTNPFLLNGREKIEYEKPFYVKN